MKFDFVVLGGAGLQGKIVSKDLLERGYSVLLCDKNKFHAKKLLKNYKRARFKYLDLKDVEKTTMVIEESCADVVVNCAEGDWNLHALQACIAGNVHSIDLGSEIWMTKKQLKMDSLLKKKNLIHITGCGATPGVGNIMLRHTLEKFDEIETVEAGFAWDSNIKKFVVPFSMQSITEEMTDSAIVLENGKFVKVKQLDYITERAHREIGGQKCFYAAQHAEPYTFYHYFKHMGLKNVRFYAGFPDHSFGNIKTLIDLGLGGKKAINFFGKKIRPIDFASEVLKRLPTPKEYREKETLWVKVYGKKNDVEKVIEMECIAPTVEGWEDAGCNIDTGIPASIIARMIKDGVIKERGSFAPEAVVPTKLFFEELAKNQMYVYENGRIINRKIEVIIPQEVRKIPTRARI